MEVCFTIEVRLPEIEIESIVVDEWGNADILLSADGVKANCRIDASGCDHNSIQDALLSLAGIYINNNRKEYARCPNISWPARRTSATM